MKWEKSFNSSPEGMMLMLKITVVGGGGFCRCFLLDEEIPF